MPAKSPPWCWWGQADAGGAPGSQSTKYSEAQPPGRRKHPLSSQENLTGQFRKPPHLLPFPPGGQWRFVLPSLPTTAPSTQGGGAGEGWPERAGHTAGTRWADLCLQAQRDGSCARVTSGVGLSIPQPCPTHGGESDRGSHFPDGDTEAPRGGQKFPHQPFFKDENPISGFQGFGKGNPGDKGLGLIASLSLFTLCTGGAASAGLPGPQSPSLPQRAWGLSQGQDWGWRAELHSPPAPA